MLAQCDLAWHNTCFSDPSVLNYGSCLEDCNMDIMPHDDSLSSTESHSSLNEFAR